MGANVSKTQATQITNVVNRSMTNMVNKTKNSTGGTSVNANNITVDFVGAEFIGCNVGITQKINATQNVSAVAKFASTADLQQKLTTAITAEAKQATKQETQALAMGVNASESDTNIENNVSNYIETNITNETLNEVNAYLAANNSLKISARKMKVDCTKGGSFLVNQEIVTSQTATMLTDAVIGNKLEQATESETDTKTSQETVQKTKGLVEGLTGLVSSLGFMILLPIIICVIVLAIFVVPMFMGGSKDTAKTAFGRKGFRFGSKGLKFGRRW